MNLNFNPGPGNRVPIRLVLWCIGLMALGALVWQLCHPVLTVQHNVVVRIEKPMIVRGK